MLRFVPSPDNRRSRIEAREMQVLWNSSYGLEPRVVRQLFSRARLFGLLPLKRTSRTSIQHDRGNSGCPENRTSNAIDFELRCLLMASLLRMTTRSYASRGGTEDQVQKMN